jgi:hypothetical protein
VLRLRDHQNKFKNPDEDDCSFFTNTRTGQRIPTRGFQNKIQGRTIGKTERSEQTSEESLGKRKVHYDLRQLLVNSRKDIVPVASRRI